MFFISESAKDEAGHLGVSQSTGGGHFQLPSEQNGATTTEHIDLFKKQPIPLVNGDRVENNGPIPLAPLRQHQLAADAAAAPMQQQQQQQQPYLKPMNNNNYIQRSESCPDISFEKTEVAPQFKKSTSLLSKMIHDKNAEAMAPPPTALSRDKRNKRRLDGFGSLESLTTEKPQPQPQSKLQGSTLNPGKGLQMNGSDRGIGPGASIEKDHKGGNLNENGNGNIKALGVAFEGSESLKQNLMSDWEPILKHLNRAQLKVSDKGPNDCGIAFSFQSACHGW